MVGWNLFLWMPSVISLSSTLQGFCWKIHWYSNQIPLNIYSPGHMLSVAAFEILGFFFKFWQFAYVLSQKWTFKFILFKVFRIPVSECPFPSSFWNFQLLNCWLIFHLLFTELAACVFLSNPEASSTHIWLPMCVLGIQTQVLMLTLPLSHLLSTYLNSLKALKFF